MALKNTTTASELFFVDTTVSTIYELIKNKKSLLKDLEEFIKRNNLEVQKNKTVCCPRCLKAHAIRTAKEKKLSEKIISKITEIDCTTGHHGYYLDSSELKKIT